LPIAFLDRRQNSQQLALGEVEDDLLGAILQQAEADGPIADDCFRDQRPLTG
jgi:hypothetical protein